MAGVPMLLKISPQKELVFRGREFTSIQTELLRLANVSDVNVAFKVKTTALKAYLVRPSSAVLRPGESTDIQIMLQKLTEVPQNYQHRFLVQAVATNETEIANKDSWAQMSKNAKMQEFRLSVVFPDVNGERGPTQYSDERDLKSKYDELGRYTQKLQEQRAVVQQEIEKLQVLSARGRKKGYQLWHILAAVIFALFAMKVLEKMALVK